MRDALKTFLQLDEHEVHTAGSLAELDAILERLDTPPTIVISDFHLGALERGSDAIDRIRVRYQRKLPAILLTGDTSAVPARLANSARLKLLNKPVDAERLVAAMGELLLAE
jgi:DNA-binding NtrC family response regulator